MKSSSKRKTEGYCYSLSCNMNLSIIWIILLSSNILAATTDPSVLARPPQTDMLYAYITVTANNLPKQIPPPPSPITFQSTPHYDQQIKLPAQIRLFWVTPKADINTLRIPPDYIQRK